MILAIIDQRNVIPAVVVTLFLLSLFTFYFFVTMEYGSGCEVPFFFSSQAEALSMVDSSVLDDTDPQPVGSDVIRKSSGIPDDFRTVVESETSLVALGVPSDPHTRCVLAYCHHTYPRHWSVLQRGMQ
jgi:hypothetical protein